MKYLKFFESPLAMILSKVAIQELYIETTGNKLNDTKSLSQDRNRKTLSFL